MSLQTNNFHLFFTQLQFIISALGHVRNAPILRLVQYHLLVCLQVVGVDGFVDRTGMDQVRFVDIGEHLQSYNHLRSTLQTLFVWIEIWVNSYRADLDHTLTIPSSPPVRW
jgi:hypothetical protein